MSEHTYKMIELVGSSTHSSDDAIHNAIAKSIPPAGKLFGVEIEWIGHLKLEFQSHILVGDLVEPNELAEPGNPAVIGLEDQIAEFLIGPRIYHPIAFGNPRHVLDAQGADKAMERRIRDQTFGPDVESVVGLKYGLAGRG